MDWKSVSVLAFAQLYEIQKKLSIHQRRQAQARSFEHDKVDEKSKTDSDAERL